MPKPFPTPAARVASELRAAGIPARMRKGHPDVISIRTYGPDDLIALRMIFPAIQNVRVQVGLQTNKK